jgi:hypothetical protein
MLNLQSSLRFGARSLLESQMADVLEPAPAPNRAFMQKALAALFTSSDVVELRTLHKAKKRVDSGYFDAEHWTDLLDAAEAANLRNAGVYVSLNPVNPQLLSRYHNRLQEFAAQTTSDRDVVRRRWLLLDLDPVRPANTGSTHAQNEASHAHGILVVKAMKERGWPVPLAAESGNGMHLLWAIDLPNDDQSTSLLKAVLIGLGTLFDADGIKVDKSVYNAARICKLWGTVSTKGDHTADAPHRLSRMLTSSTKAPVSRDQLEEIAGVGALSRKVIVHGATINCTSLTFLAHARI